MLLPVLIFVAALALLVMAHVVASMGPVQTVADHGLFTEALISAIAQAAPEAKARLRAFLEGKAAKVRKDA